MKRVAAAFLALGACRGEPAPTTTATTTATANTTATATANTNTNTNTKVARDACELRTPKRYDATKPTPLVVALHGYGGDGRDLERYWRLGALADAKTFLLAVPDGTPDAQGKRFWNATDACCNFDGSAVDDVAYLSALVEDAKAKYNVDPKRVFVVGHSNGGFMAMRLACDLAPRVAAVVSLAGAAWKETTRCSPTERVSVLQVHGTADKIIRMGGGRVFDRTVAPYPSVGDTVALWAAKNGCTGERKPNGRRLDLVVDLPGAETRVEPYRGCPAGGAVELWTIERGVHAPWLEWDWSVAMYGWLSAHAKP